MNTLTMRFKTQQLRYMYLADRYEHQNERLSFMFRVRMCRYAIALTYLDKRNGR